MKKITLFVISVLIILSINPAYKQNIVNASQFDLKAIGECGFVNLSWNPISGADGYWIYRGKEKGKEFATPLTDFPVSLPSFTDDINIEDNQQYCYFVTAVDKNAKEFAKSEEACASTNCKNTQAEPSCKLVLKYQVDNAIYWVNDDSKGPMETPPVIINARVFLVIRYVTSEIDGTLIDWVASEKKIKITTRRNDILELWIGKKDARINGKSIQIDPNNPKVVPVIKDGRTLLPMRFVAENLGAAGADGIKWFDATKIVQMTIDDPVCDKEGFRYPNAKQLKGSLFEFSIEYHIKNDGQFPDVVGLGLVKSDNTKPLRLGASKRDKATILDLTEVKTPQPRVEDIKSSFGKAKLYRFRLTLEYGVLHFYKFTSSGSSMPKEGYLGPVSAALPNARMAKNADLDKKKEGDALIVQGFFTNEPYPCIVDDYWSIFEIAQSKANKVPVRLEKGQIIEDGSFVCIDGKKKSTDKGLSMLTATKILSIQKIERQKLISKEFRVAIPPVVCPNKFAIIYAGVLDDAEVKDEDKVKHVYQRLRVDFVGNVLSNYKTCFNLGLCKQNIYVCFGRGDSEIDEICADDGDGNPFDFEWNDRECRTAMENDAQNWWRQGDGWTVKKGSSDAFKESVDAIKAKIDALPSNVTPEVYIFIGTHGNVDFVGTYNNSWITYNQIVDHIKGLIATSGPSIYARSKIRFLLDTCHAGSIIDNMQNNFKSSGGNYLQLAASCSGNELGYGIWEDFEVTSYANAGGSFGIPFRISLNEQSKINPENQADWKVAYDYAIQNDIFVPGYDAEQDDGSIITIYTHPQYWHSHDLTSYMNGPGFEDPLVPNDEVRVNTCRIGIDASNLTFDFCNCTKTMSVEDFPSSSFTIVNRGMIPFRIVDIKADETVLTKTTSGKVINFSLHGGRCVDDSYFDFSLGYEQSQEVYVCIIHHRLNAQPLDANGYMATVDGLPAYVEVPIIVTYEFVGERYNQRATARVRVKGEAYQMLYQTYETRTEGIKGKIMTWNPVSTDVDIVSAYTGLPQDVLCGPKLNGGITMNVKTDIFSNAGDKKTNYGYLKSFKIDFYFEDWPSEGCNDEFDWGWVSGAVLPDNSKNLYKVMYPTGTDLSYKKITIIFTPNAHSKEGFNSIIGKHNFRFTIIRLSDLNCDQSVSESGSFDLNLTIEFTSPK